MHPESTRPTCWVPGCENLATRGDVCEQHHSNETQAYSPEIPQSGPGFYERETLTPFGQPRPPVEYPDVDRSAFLDGKGTLYGLKAFEGTLSDGRAMEQEGIGRNNMLSRTAFRVGQLVGSGDIDAAYAGHMLHRLAIAICPDERAKAANTVKRGLREGTRYPRGSSR